MPLHNLSGEVVGVLGIYQDITVRKQLEVELKNSQKRLREVLDSAIAGITRVHLYPDRSIQYDYISPHGAAMLGYTVEELWSLPDCCLSTIEPDDWTTAILPVIEAILQNRGTCTHQMEYRLRRKDGSIFWVLASCYAQWSGVDGYWTMTNVETDISDRKKAESQLQNLILGSAAVGADFFPALVRHIAEALEVSHVFAVECIGTKIHELAVWSNGKLQVRNTTASSFINTPCQQTLQAGIYHCEHSVQQLFPDCSVLQEMGAESYLGIALRDTHGDTIGVLHIVHDNPLKDPQRAQQILQIFAARAVAELERQRINNALEQLNQALEIKVAERTAELQERKQFLQTVLDTFPLHIFWKDQNSVYLGGNKNFLARTGLASVDDMKGRQTMICPGRQLKPTFIGPMIVKSSRVMPPN